MAAASPVTTIDLTQFSEIVDNAHARDERGQSLRVDRVRAGKFDIQRR